jgi:hypothetical protein
VVPSRPSSIASSSDFDEFISPALAALDALLLLELRHCSNGKAAAMVTGFGKIDGGLVIIASTPCPLCLQFLI